MKKLCDMHTQRLHYYILSMKMISVYGLNDRKDIVRCELLENMCLIPVALAIYIRMNIYTPMRIVAVLVGCVFSFFGRTNNCGALALHSCVNTEIY